MMRELLHRRVPHILGAYLATGWLVLEFTDWAVNRYVLSSYLTDFVVAGWLLLVPGVFMVAWFHGKPGRDRWSRFEKIGLAVNLVVATAVLFGLFRGRDLGAATTTVVVQDEEGTSVEREVPKSAFRKSVLVFPFDNRSGDPALDGLEYGVPAALRFDLLQDLFLNVPGPETWMSRLREEGFAEGLDVPLTLKRNVADRLHSGHFVLGTIGDSSGTPLLTVALYETRRGKLLHERTYAGEDELELVDAMTEQLRSDLELPAQHIEESVDLPVAEMLTSDPAAYRTYIAGEEAALKRLDYEEAAARWQEAVDIDPGFAFAWIRLYEARTLLNQPARGTEALETAMGLLYKLPERIQFPVKAAYYWLVRQDIERAIATGRMWAELAPEEVGAHLMLAQFHQARNETSDAIRELQIVVELDPSRIEQLQAIAGFYRARAEYDTALAYLSRYAAAAPEDPAAFTAIGDLHRQRGDAEEARGAYERALVIDPDDVEALVGLARLDRDVGAFADAEAGYAEALRASTTPEQRASVHDALKDYYAFRGKMDLAISQLRLNWEELAAALPPLVVVQRQLNDLGLYARAGRAREGQAVLDSLAARLTGQFAVLAYIGEFTLAVDGEDAEAIKAAREGFERLMQTFGLGADYALRFADGRIAELRGDCRRAIRLYAEALELAPANRGAALYSGRCYRKLRRFDEARAELEGLLREVPLNPRAHYELALVSADAGSREEAVDHLRTAMGVWGAADPDYPLARQARDKLAELEGG